MADFLEEVQFALDRAQRVLRSSQRSDGSWDSPGQVGAWVTAQVVTVLRFLRALDDADTAAAAKWLRSQQRADGSFAIHPYATRGDLGATAASWAALHLCGARTEAARAEAWVERHGGVAAVLDRITEGDLSALFLGMAGLVPASKLPCPSTAAMLFPPALRFLETRFHSGVFMLAFEFELLVKKLRGDFGLDGTKKTFVDLMTCNAATTVLRTFQNDNGSWNDSAVISVLALPCLDAIDSPESRKMLERALEWLETQKVRDDGGLRFDGFGTEVWSTAFDTRALLAAGVAPNDPGVRRALGWLVDAQLARLMPRVDNRQPNAVLTGGWAFQRTNHTMPDCDDAGVVLSTLGLALAARGQASLDEASSAKVERSARLGVQWLLGMQNPDGGWSAFVWGLQGKRPGPIMETNPRVDLTNPVDLLEAVVDVPPPMGDPSTEDLTSRVLHGLGHLGFDETHPAVSRAVDFLKAQQASNGAWWGRWVLNYLSSTAFVLMGLAAVKVDLSQPWVRRAVRFLLEHQNADGGWGETPASYRSLASAGVGPTMLPLTALVVQALIDVGEGDTPAVEKAVQLLVTSQQPDGTWSNGSYLHVNVPPDTFYVYPEAARFYPAEALGMYLTLRRNQASGLVPRRPFSNERLDTARQQTDDFADQVVADLFARHDVAAVNEVMTSIFRTDEPIPPGLPPVARAYFSNVQLPAWADAAAMDRAQRLFTRCGWQMATCLFCSSLPQAYAAARGAHVLTQSQAMTRHVHQRIFETAQFLFDACGEGAFQPDGRGVRSIQKVRLMHATVRHFLLNRPEAPWDTGFFGLPLNQEDMAGTLMTFSICVLDGLESLGVQLSDQERTDWLHHWRVVGALMGVKEDLLPNDLDDAHELMEAIRTRQWRQSEDGRALVKPLISMMQGYFGPAFSGFPVALIRRLAGDHCADLLGLPAADWSERVVEILAELEAHLSAGDPEDVARRIFDTATFKFMEMFVTASREGKQAKFRIPPSLKHTIDPSR